MSIADSQSIKNPLPKGIELVEEISKHSYFILNKPYNMVSQFVSPHKVALLGDLGFSFPKGTHAIGRLDHNSEGLLLLTTNKKVTRLLFSGIKPHKRVYLVQINGILKDENLHRLRNGVLIRTGIEEYYTTPACEVEIVKDPSKIYTFSNDCADFGPHTWLSITLYEGKYHQVRKMMGAIHHRCKRLIRISIERIELNNLGPGCLREIAEDEFFNKLDISL